MNHSVSDHNNKRCWNMYCVLPSNVIIKIIQTVTNVYFFFVSRYYFNLYIEETYITILKPSADKTRRHAIAYLYAKSIATFLLFFLVLFEFVHRKDIHNCLETILRQDNKKYECISIGKNRGYV